MNCLRLASFRDLGKLAMSNWVYINVSMLSVLNDSYVYKWLILAYITYITLLQCTRVHGVYEWHSSRENCHWTETISERARYREYWPPHCIYIVYLVLPSLAHTLYVHTLDRVWSSAVFKPYCVRVFVYTTLLYCVRAYNTLVLSEEVGHDLNRGETYTGQQCWPFNLLSKHFYQLAFLERLSLLIKSPVSLWIVAV